MGRFLTLVGGVIAVIVFAPLLLTGLGEFVMGLPVIGACIATLAAVLLNKRRGS